jgi:hypothetical protein
MTAAMLAAGAAAQEPAPLLDATAVQAVLRPDEIVVAFTLAEPNSFRWVISREHFVFDRIAGRTAIEMEAARLRDLLGAPLSGNALNDASKQLGAMLFDRISTADDRPLIVIPDGVLHDVAFERLELQGRPLGERHKVSYAASPNALVQARRERPPGKRETAPLALAIGLALASLLVALARVRKSAQKR